MLVAVISILIWYKEKSVQSVKTAFTLLIFNLEIPLLIQNNL